MGKPEGNAVGNAVGKVFGNGGKVLGNGGRVLGKGKGKGNVLLCPASATVGAPASVGRITVGALVGVRGVMVGFDGRPGVSGVIGATAGELGWIALLAPASISGLTVVSGVGASATSGASLESD